MGSIDPPEDLSAFNNVFTLAFQDSATDVQRANIFDVIPLNRVNGAGSQHRRLRSSFQMGINIRYNPSIHSDVFKDKIAAAVESGAFIAALHTRAAAANVTDLVTMTVSAFSVGAPLDGSGGGGGGGDTDTDGDLLSQVPLVSRKIVVVVIIAVCCTVGLLVVSAFVSHYSRLDGEQLR